MSYIKKEVELGGLVQSGAHDEQGKVKKWECRVIVDLSFPENNGPNYLILKNLVFGRNVNHVLPSVNDAVKIIASLDFNVLLASVDIARAYRNFKVDPLDWPLTCIWAEGGYYVDVCMPFGSRLSLLYMQRMVCSIQRALLRRQILSVVYLDDLLIICQRNQDPEKQFAIFLEMLRQLGLPITWEKVVSPARVIRFLGIIINLDNREIHMPREKIERFLQLIDSIYHKKYIRNATYRVS